MINPFSISSTRGTETMLVAMVLLMVTMVIAITTPEVFALDEEHETSDEQRSRITAATVLGYKRHLEEEASNNPPRAKRTVISWNWERARNCIHEDYWGPRPTFNDRMFERVFRVTRSIADCLMNICGQAHPWFRSTTLVTGEQGIDPKAKLLIALKSIAYGVSPSAFLDYFQMGLTTAQHSVKLFSNIVANDDTLKSEFRRAMNRNDAMKASQAYFEYHGVRGQIGCLDCMHVAWRLCPYAWQGQYKGAKKKPTIILEAFCDHFLYFWHASFGLAGSLNDINVWDQSPLLKQFIDGTFSANADFTYEIAGQFFHQVWIMVDGIYPELSRFVKTISEPVGSNKKGYAKWQEAVRKDIERAFGILQRKFHILVKAIEYWFLGDISDIVYCCVTLHNMMVVERVARDEMDAVDWYEEVRMEGNDQCDHIDPDTEYVERQLAELDLHRRLQETFYDGPAIRVNEGNNHRTRALENARQDVVNRRWDCLYSGEEHFKLRNAIMDEIEKQGIDQRIF